MIPFLRVYPIQIKTIGDGLWHWVYLIMAPSPNGFIVSSLRTACLGRPAIFQTRRLEPGFGQWNPVSPIFVAEYKPKSRSSNRTFAHCLPNFWHVVDRDDVNSVFAKSSFIILWMTSCCERSEFIETPAVTPADSSSVSPRKINSSLTKVLRGPNHTNIY